MGRVEFAEYVESLLSYLWRAHGAAASGIRLTLDLAPVSLSVNAAVPCGLILNELATNALKHAFRGTRRRRSRGLATGPCRRAACASARATTARGCRPASTGGRPTRSACGGADPRRTTPRHRGRRQRRGNRVYYFLFPRAQMSKAAILIVEDEGLVAADLAGKLRRLGYEVAGIAAEGEEAVAVCEPRSPRPGPHGHLAGGTHGRDSNGRGIHRQNDVPIIYLTAHSDPATLDRPRSPTRSATSSNRSRSGNWPSKSSWRCTSTRPTANSTNSANGCG